MCKVFRRFFFQLIFLGCFGYGFSVDLFSWLACLFWFSLSWLYFAYNEYCKIIIDKAVTVSHALASRLF